MQAGETDSGVDGHSSGQVDLSLNLRSAAPKLPSTLGKFLGLSEAALSAEKHLASTS